MTNKEIITALRRNMVETGSLICLGCGYEHSCATRGCAIMRSAADAIEQFAVADNKPLTLEELRGMDGEPVWCEKKSAYVFVSTIIDEPYLQVYYFTNRGFLETSLYYHTKFYRRPPEKE